MTLQVVAVGERGELREEMVVEEEPALDQLHDLPRPPADCDSAESSASEQLDQLSDAGSETPAAPVLKTR